MRTVTRRIIRVPELWFAVVCGLFVLAVSHVL